MAILSLGAYNGTITSMSYTSSDVTGETKTACGELKSQEPYKSIRKFVMTYRYAGWKDICFVDGFGAMIWYKVWSWDFWWKRWKQVAHKPRTISNKISKYSFISGFKSFNRGRRFDRKRR